ncbi:O-antigen ligase family protein [Cellulophaga fucicola]|uniref:O-antigen ligase family protein n=1 Tax=Cellulophaga fucicola TaxID=76595 RepID=UPI003EBFE2C3
MKNRIPGYLLFLCCLGLPFSYQLSTFFLLLFSVASLLLNSTLVNFKANMSFNETLNFPWIIFGFPLMGFFFTNFKEDSLDQLVKYIPYFLTSVVYLFAKKEYRLLYRKQMTLGLITGVSLTVVYLLSVNFYNFYKSNDTLLELLSYKYTYNNFLRPIDSHPTYLGVIILISNYFISFVIKNKAIKCFLFFLNIFALITLMSKVIIIGFLIQILMKFLSLTKLRTKIIISLLAVSFAFFTLYLYKNHLKDVYFLQRFSIELFWDVNSSNQGVSANGRVKDDSRFSRWSAIWDKANDSLMFGYGSGSEEQILSEVYKEHSLLVSLQRNYNTHNQYLFYILEYGIIIALLFFSFLVVNFIFAFKRKDYFFVFFTFLLILICCFENYFNRTMGVLLISIVLTFAKNENKKNIINF